MSQTATMTDVFGPRLRCAAVRAPVAEVRTRADRVSHRRPPARSDHAPREPVRYRRADQAVRVSRSRRGRRSPDRSSSAFIRTRASQP